ncbi:uncharacterized protein EI90DRAFT_3154338, partial [Cantharellus anzutake]|uniref:uncharacterized protein n=1 Tax=Cantharellus anzutake TaxID=1750568 RepID=UPI001903DE8D
MSRVTSTPLRHHVLQPEPSASAWESICTQSIQAPECCQAIRRGYSRRQNLVIAWHIIYGALDRTEDPIKNRLRNQPEFHAYLKSDGGWPERELTELLRSMANNRVPWSDSFKNEAFLIPELEPTENETDEDLTTILAWDSTFKGDLANVLLETIADYLSEDGTPHLASIINSSGTGKSRMVDQLGKGIISVPMCLRPGSEGFPPPDEILRAWLVSGTDDRTTVQKKLYGFVYSLLVVTLRKLETTVSKKQDIPKLPLDAASTKKLSKEKLKDYVSLVVDRHKRLASAFRKYMTTGQSHHATNPDRKTFYHEVIELANKFVKNGAHGWYVSRGDGLLQEAGERLCRFIDEHKVLESDSGPQRPLVVLAFDEAHVLTDNPPDQEGWNLFSELRRILQQIHDLPIFSLFISTAGRLNQFSPEIRSGPSAWASEPDHRPLNLISEISFDDIAYPALKDTVTIHRV